MSPITQLVSECYVVYITLQTYYIHMNHYKQLNDLFSYPKRHHTYKCKSIFWEPLANSLYLSLPLSTLFSRESFKVACILFIAKHFSLYTRLDKRFRNSCSTILRFLFIVSETRNVKVFWVQIKTVLQEFKLCTSE